MTDKAAMKQRVFERAEAANVRFVNLQFTDIMGLVKNVHIPIHKLEDAIDHGLWFDGSSVEGFARIHESDMYLEPDLSTFGSIPWERGDERRPPRCSATSTPRTASRSTAIRAASSSAAAARRRDGLRFQTGPELEFFLLRRRQTARSAVEPLPHDQAGYFDVTTDLAADVRKEMVNALEDQGIVVEASHHEVAVGQHEIDFKYAGPADGRQRGHVPRDAEGDRPAARAVRDVHAEAVLRDQRLGHAHATRAWLVAGRQRTCSTTPTTSTGCRDLAQHFIAGQLAHARGMSAILAPLVNSYKRLVPGYEAPVYVSWARINRSALIRVPQTTRGRPEATRIELRCPDPSCNPYLAFAVMLAAGLDGVERKLELPRPVEENLYHFDDQMMRSTRCGMLPGTLEEALDEFAADEVIQRRSASTSASGSSRPSARSGTSTASASRRGSSSATSRRTS